MMRDEFDTDTDNMEPPTPRDIVQAICWTVIIVTILGYLALWRTGVI